MLNLQQWSEASLQGSQGEAITVQDGEQAHVWIVRQSEHRVIFSLLSVGLSLYTFSSADMHFDSALVILPLCRVKLSLIVHVQYSSLTARDSSVYPAEQWANHYTAFVFLSYPAIKQGWLWLTNAECHSKKLQHWFHPSHSTCLILPAGWDVESLNRLMN